MPGQLYDDPLSRTYLDVVASIRSRNDDLRDALRCGLHGAAIGLPPRGQDPEMDEEYRRGVAARGRRKADLELSTARHARNARRARRLRRERRAGGSR